MKIANHQSSGSWTRSTRRMYKWQPERHLTVNYQLQVQPSAVCSVTDMLLKADRGSHDVWWTEPGVIKACFDSLQQTRQEAAAAASAWHTPAVLGCKDRWGVLLMLKANHA